MEAHVGHASPTFFCYEQASGAPITASPKPQGRGARGGLGGSRASEAGLLLGTISGSPATADPGWDPAFCPSDC